jgi:hypothetical protein
MVAAAAPDGAVVGVTAMLDHSHLTAGIRTGAPLFADLAHRFTVRVPATAVAGREDELIALIDSHAPAHTNFALCLIAADARVGRQSTLGVDLIVGGPRRPLELGTPSEPRGAVLAGHSPRLGAERLK